MADQKANYAYFQANLERLIKENNGKFVVIYDGKDVGFFNSFMEAYDNAKEKYIIGTFLVQECSEFGNRSYYYSYQLIGV